MEVDGDRCSRCGAAGAWARCLACYEADHPPMVQRGAKWSPLAIAGLSVVCDPLMIPSILAIVRAIGELREVGRREAFGLHREEHASVRTGAVWALVIAAARPLLFATWILILAVRGALFAPAYPQLPADELGEILDRLRSSDAEVRAVALDHLSELGPALSEAEVTRTLDVVDEGFGHGEAEELETRSAAVAAVSSAGAVAEQMWPRFSRLYPTLDADGREALLGSYVDRGTPSSLRFFAALAGGDHDPEGPWLSPLALERQAGQAELFVEPLVRLPAEASLRHELPWLLSRLCEQGLDPRVLAPVRARLIADWQATRDALAVPPSSLEARTSLQHMAPVTRAQLQLDALRCVAGADVDALLDEAAGHPDSLVAVAAVSALLARRRPVQSALFAPLAADPVSRADLLDALERHGRGLEVPAEHRTERAIAEGHLLRALRVEQIAVVAYTWVERVEPRPGQAMHVFRVTYPRATPGYLAVGPYPEVQHGGERLLSWWRQRPSAAELADELAERAGERWPYEHPDALRDRVPEVTP